MKEKEKCRKSIIFSIIYLCSAASFFVLFIQPNLTGGLILFVGMAVSAVLLLNLLKNNNSENKTENSRKMKTFIIIESLIISVFVAFSNGGLSEKFSDSSFINDILQKIGINKNTFFALLSIVLGVISVFFIYTVISFFKADGKNNGNGKIKTNVFDYKFFKFAVVAGIIALSCLTIYCFYYEITVDDAFSLQMIKRNFKNIALLTARDFHPPLYYFLLKIFVGVFGIFKTDEIILGKLFSVLPYFILFAQCLAGAKKDKSKSFVYGLSMLLLSAFSCTYFQAVQIRMYTWGLLFVLATFLSAKSVVKDNFKTADLVKLTLFALFSCYTQYFASVAAVIIYAFVLFFGIIKKNKNTFKVFLSGICVVLGYLPWMFVFIRQFTTTFENENALNVVANSLNDYIYYFFNGLYYPQLQIFIRLCFLILLLSVISQIIFNRRKDGNSEKNFDIAGFLLVVFVALFGDIVSVIGNPILLPRYLYMSLGVTVFSAALLLKDAEINIKKSIVAILTVLLFINCGNFTVNQINKSEEAGKVRKVAASQSVDKIYLERNGATERCIKQLLNCKTVLFSEDKFKEDYEIQLKKYKESTIKVFDEVVFGSENKTEYSKNCDYLIKELQDNKTIFIAVMHNGIIDCLKENTACKVVDLDCRYEGYNIYKVQIEK